MMSEWNSLISLPSLARKWGLHLTDLSPVIEEYPFRMSEHVEGLIRNPGDPIWRQVVPDIAEAWDGGGFEDPLAEERLSPIPNLVHRYPNRVLWLVNDQCAVHCRFCTRKRKWKEPFPLTDELFQEGLDYIRANNQIRDVLLSGGDPLLLSVDRLAHILESLRKVPHVEIIRIGTRVPCALPAKVTPELPRMLSKYSPLFMNLHFNHPRELTEESVEVCGRLADAGIVLGSQTVLLREVNDDPETLAELFQGLLKARVRPYYLMQMDLTRGTAHFRTPVGVGLEIVSSLRKLVSGLAVPHYVIDLPGGHGKVPLTPNHVEAVENGRMIVRDPRGNPVLYPLLDGEAEHLISLFPSLRLKS